MQDNATSSIISLRDVAETDLPTFFEQQRDPLASAMAGFPARERGAFFAHWHKILAGQANINQTVLCNEAIAGNIACFPLQGEYAVGYWFGRAFWGQGIATQALTAFLKLVPQRPLIAEVAIHNRASRRVLEKCGFVAQHETPDEVVLRLGA